MANLQESAVWEDGIYQWETEDPVVGGADGIDNVPTRQLANRTKYLKKQVELKAPLDSPIFTGEPEVPTAAADTSTTLVASTAFVIGQAATVKPVVNGVAAVGTSKKFARQDHVHPNDETRVSIGNLQKGIHIFAVDTGIANAYVCNFTPVLDERGEGQVIRFKVANTNTGAVTINDGLGVVPLVGGAHSALQGGELVAGGNAFVQWNSTIGTGSYVLLLCTGVSLVKSKTKTNKIALSGNLNLVTGIPLWVRKITVVLESASVTENTPLLIQVGNSSLVTTGYSSVGTGFGGTTTASTAFTAGFGLEESGNAANSCSGIFTLTSIDGLTWVISGGMRRGSPSAALANGVVTMASVLQRLAVTCVSGTATFDSGSFYCIFEE